MYKIAYVKQRGSKICKNGSYLLGEDVPIMDLLGTETAGKCRVHYESIHLIYITQ